MLVSSFQRSIELGSRQLCTVVVYSYNSIVAWHSSHSNCCCCCCLLGFVARNQAEDRYTAVIDINI